MKKTPSKYEGLGAAMTAKLVIGFLVILAIRTVNSLDHCVEVLMSSK